MEHPVADFYAELRVATQKARFPKGKPGSCAILTQDQPRVRERIMKLSKVYSATCHHKY